MIHLKPLTPAADRAFQIYYAKVLLNQARAWRHRPADHARMLSYAADVRRAALKAAGLIERDLFGAEREGRT